VACGSVADVAARGHSASLVGIVARNRGELVSGQVDFNDLTVTRPVSIIAIYSRCVFHINGFISFAVLPVGGFLRKSFGVVHFIYPSR
jgi:hypothetical protein